MRCEGCDKGWTEEKWTAWDKRKGFFVFHQVPNGKEGELLQCSRNIKEETDILNKLTQRK